jgi:hypothetical protein
VQAFAQGLAVFALGANQPVRDVILVEKIVESPPSISPQ